MRTNPSSRSYPEQDNAGSGDAWKRGVPRSFLMARRPSAANAVAPR